MLIGSSPRAVELDTLGAQAQFGATVASAFYEFLGSERELEDASQFAKKALPAIYGLTSKTYQLIQAHRENRPKRKILGGAIHKPQKYLSLPLFMMSNIDTVYKYYYWVARDIARKTDEEKTIFRRELDLYALSDTILAAQERDIYLKDLPDLILEHLHEHLTINAAEIVSLLKQTKPSTPKTSSRKRQEDIDDFLLILATEIVTRFDELKRELNSEFLNGSDIRYIIGSFYGIHRDPWEVASNITTLKGVFGSQPNLGQIVGMLTGFEWSDVLTKGQDTSFRKEFSFLRSMDDIEDDDSELFATSHSGNVTYFRVQSNSPIKRRFDIFWAYIKSQNPALFAQVNQAWQKQKARLIALKKELESLRVKAVKASVKMAKILKSLIAARNTAVKGIKEAADIVKETQLVENQEIRALIEIIDSLPEKVEIPYVDEIAAGNFDFTQDLLRQELALEHEQLPYLYHCLIPPSLATSFSTKFSSAPPPLTTPTSSSTPYSFSPLQTHRLFNLISQKASIQSYLASTTLIKGNWQEQLERLTPNLKQALPFLLNLPDYLTPAKSVLDSIKEKGLRLFPLRLADVFKSSLTGFFTALLQAKGSDMIRYLLSLSPEQHERIAVIEDRLINELPRLIEGFPDPETSTGWEIIEYIIFKVSDIDEINDLILTQFPDVTLPDLQNISALKIIEHILNQQTFFSILLSYLPDIYSMPALKRLANTASIILFKYIMATTQIEHPPAQESQILSTKANEDQNTPAPEKLLLAAIGSTPEEETEARQAREQEDFQIVTTNPLALITSILQGYPEDAFEPFPESEIFLHQPPVFANYYTFTEQRLTKQARPYTTYIPQLLLNNELLPTLRIQLTSEFLSYYSILAETPSYNQPLEINIKTPIAPKYVTIKISHHTSWLFSSFLLPSLPLDINLVSNTNPQPFLLKTSFVTNFKAEKKDPKIIEPQIVFETEDDGPPSSNNSNNETTYLIKPLPKEVLNFFSNLKIFFTSRKEIYGKHACIYFL